jgi:hypothetical protein
VSFRQRKQAVLLREHAYEPAQQTAVARRHIQELNAYRVMFRLSLTGVHDTTRPLELIVVFSGRDISRDIFSSTFSAFPVSMSMPLQCLGIFYPIGFAIISPVYIIY